MSDHEWGEPLANFARVCLRCGKSTAEVFDGEPCPGVPTPEPEGVKHDDGKAPWHLLPWRAVEAVVRVLGHGARKYAPDNWRKVESWRDRYFSAAVRHLVAWERGEKLDPETGEPHLAHAVCCVLFMLARDQDGG